MNDSVSRAIGWYFQQEGKPTDMNAKVTRLVNHCEQVLVAIRFSKRIVYLCEGERRESLLYCRNKVVARVHFNIVLMKEERENRKCQVTLTCHKFN